MFTLVRLEQNTMLLVAAVDWLMPWSVPHPNGADMADQSLHVPMLCCAVLCCAVLAV